MTVGNLNIALLRKIYAYARNLSYQRSPATQTASLFFPFYKYPNLSSKILNHFVLLSQFHSLAKMSNTESSEEKPEFLRNDDHERWGASDSDDPDFDPSNFAVSTKL